MTDIDLATRFPHLSQGARWRNTALTGCRLVTGTPDATRLQSVNMIPFVGDRVIVIALKNRHIMLPGGTRERGESLMETITREMREETGYALESCTPFAVLECISFDAKPWREHLVHPEFERLVCFGDVHRVGPPENPEGAEHVTRVDVLSLDDAVWELRSTGRAELADLYLLAAEIRQTAQNLPELTMSI